MTQAKEFYRRDIDGLRAVAITVVVAYHLGIPGMAGGFVGVDVFFVLSGFLITSLLVAEIHRSGTLSLQGFFARRIRRLFPALVVVVVVVCLIGAFALLPIFGQQQELGRSAIATALYVSNFHFWLNSPGYFDASSDLMPLLHTWSLSVEEQFYLAWPPAVLAVAVFARRRNWRFERSLMSLIAVILVVSLAWCIRVTRDDPTAAFYLLPSRAWELATGAVLALWLPRLTTERPLAGTLCSVAGAIALGAAVVMLHEDLAIPGYLVVAPVFGTALIVLGGHVAKKNPVQAVLSTRPMVTIGLLSYSWYLWHWPLLALSRAYELEAYNPARDLGIGLLSLSFAYASYRFVEQPIRLGRPGPFRRDGTTLAAGLLVSLVICFAAGALVVRANHEASRPEYAALISAKEDRPPLRSACHQSVPFEALAPSAQCVSGDRDRAPSLLLWGDSHADHLSPMMQAFAASSPATPTLARSFPRCPPFALYEKRDAREEAACESFNAAVLAEARALSVRGLHGVVLSGHWLRVFGAPRLQQMGQDAGAANPPVSRPELAASLADTVRQLTGLGLRVVIVAPLPEMPYDVPACLARRSPYECNVKRAVVDRQRRAVMTLLTGIQRRFPGVQLLDLIDSVCDAETCYAERDGRILYLDDDHLTASASRSMMPVARASLLRAAATE